MIGRGLRASLVAALVAPALVVLPSAPAQAVTGSDWNAGYIISDQAFFNGWAMSADAFHVVAPNPVTVTRCMADAIRHAGIAPEAIASVSAHAASTKVGDQVEADALKAVFGDKIPPLSANKSLMGHAMGATSAIESILALEGMRRGVLLPTINHHPDPAIPLDCCAEGARRLDQEYVLKNAFGFGGCNACLVFRRIN